VVRRRLNGKVLRDFTVNGKPESRRPRKIRRSLPFSLLAKANVLPQWFIGNTHAMSRDLYVLILYPKGYISTLSQTVILSF
jgi:hypothetical protein